LSPVSNSEQLPIEEQLNSASVLPSVAYRRNHKIYELVAYVNCLLGCRIARNPEGEELFRDRIEKYISDNPPDPRYAEYYQLVKKYAGISD
jgi:hypothetical protein